MYINISIHKYTYLHIWIQICTYTHTHTLAWVYTSFYIINIFMHFVSSNIFLHTRYMTATVPFRMAGDTTDKFSASVILPLSNDNTYLIGGYQCSQNFRQWEQSIKLKGKTHTIFVVGRCIVYHCYCGRMRRQSCRYTCCCCLRLL